MWKNWRSILLLLFLLVPRESKDGIEKIPENVNSPNEMQIMCMCNCNTCATGKENSFINFINHDYLQKSILKEIFTILVEYLHFANFLEVLVLASRLFEHYKC